MHKQFFKTFETKEQCVIFKHNSPGEMWYGRIYLRKNVRYVLISMQMLQNSK